MSPRVFIGSSTQGLQVAEAIQKELSHDAEVIIWSQGVFRQTNVAIEDLMRALNEFDFAVFVFLPEDILNIREKKTISVRDNVLFELGLFLGKLGRQRNFFVAPKSEPRLDLHLPSDLSGITPSTYDPRATNLQASIGAALYEIKQSIRRQTILYDGRKDFRPDYFEHRNGCFWKDRKPISPISEGSLEIIPGGVLRVERKTLEGRYEIELRPDGRVKPSICKKQEPAHRVLRVSCEAKVDSGQHTLRFVLKDIEADGWAASKTKNVSSTDWTSLEVYLTVLPTVDLLFRIDDETPSNAPSSVYLRSLVIAEGVKSNS